MAIYGFGASYSNKDVSSQFIERGIACVGWNEKVAPTLHNLLRHIKIGDIVYIKSHPPNIGLIIKAVGVVTGETTDEELGAGVCVRWAWTGEDRMGQLEDKYPVRNLTLYEEYNQAVQKRIIDLLLGER